jgi:hypothetical protein
MKTLKGLYSTLLEQSLLGRMYCLKIIKSMRKQLVKIVSLKIYVEHSLTRCLQQDIYKVRLNLFLLLTGHENGYLEVSN